MMKKPMKLDRNCKIISSNYNFLCLTVLSMNKV